MATATATKHHKTKAPQVKDQPLFIGGKWLDSASNKTFPAINPATGETICQVAEGDKADINLAVKAARKAVETGPWKKMDAVDRGRLMFKLADLIEKEADELAALESLNCGKTITDAKGDIQRGAEVIEFAIGIPHLMKGEFTDSAGPGTDIYSMRQPLGVVVSVSLG